MALRTKFPEKAGSTGNIALLGNGLIEIAALTALIGSGTTELLTLGHRGAAGLPWAAISAFGTLSLVKTCLSACTPCWLQDALGTQNAATDAALGFKLNLQRKALQRSTCSNPIGLVYAQDTPSLRSKFSNSRQQETNSNDMGAQAVYRFDSDTSNLLRVCCATGAKLPANKYMYLRDVNWRARSKKRAKHDWAVILASLSKFLEVATLWHLGATKLSIVGMLPWLFFFLSASLFQLLKLSRGACSAKQQLEYDVVAGELPTPLGAGGERKILFGVPQNIRAGVAWYLVWALGGLVCLACLIVTYVILSQTTTLDIYIWLGFQLIWVAFRSVVFYFAENTSESNGSVVAIPAQTNAADNIDERLIRLITAVSRYQIARHCRGIFCYGDDLQVPSAIRNLLKQSPLVDRLLEGEDLGASGTNLDVEIIAVIGDTLFSSMAWILGLPVKHEIDFFDSCLIEIKIGSSKFLVPASRVTSEVPFDIPRDEEKPPEPAFYPRGGINTGTHTQWIYWVPFATNKWIEIQTKDIRAIGKMSAIIMTDEELTSRLGRGDLWISLKDVSEIYEAVEMARMATEHLMQLYNIF